MSPDPTEQFIAAAVRPLESNAEMKAMTEQELRHTIGQAGDIEPHTLEAACQRLEKADRNPRWKSWRVWLYSIASLVSVVVGLISLRFWLDYRQHIGLINTLGGGGSTFAVGKGDPDAYILKGKTPEEKLLLFGDRDRAPKSFRMKALWESQPDNVSYYIDYAAAHISGHQDLPEGFLETGERLDPDNAWFPAVAASVAANQAAFENPRTEQEKKDKVPRSFTVKDPAKLEEAMALFSKAAALSRFETYQHDLSAARLRLLPPRRDSLDQFSSVAYAAGIGSASMHLMHLHKALFATCETIEREKDHAALKRLAADWERFVLIYARSRDSTLIDPLLKLAITKAVYTPIQRTAKALEMEEEASHSKRILDRHADRKDRANERSKNQPDWKSRGSMLASLTLPTISKQSASAREVTDADLKPGRLAEHEFMAKALFAGASITMAVLALIVALYRFRGSLSQRMLSSRVASLLGARDWAWIIGLGALTPLLLYHVLARLPWLGGREYSLYASKFGSPCAPFAFLIWLLIILPIVLARWRFGKAAGFIGARWPHPWIGWAIVALLAIPLPFSAVMMLPEYNSMAANITVIAAIQLAQFWFLVMWLRGLFGKQLHLTKRIALSRTVLPAYAASLLLCSLSVLFCHYQETRWLQQEHLVEVSADEPAMSRFEYHVMQSLRGELLEILGAKP